MIEKCPTCGSPLEPGFLGTEQKGGAVFLGGLRCSRIIWSKDFKMGFSGTPKGEDVATQNTHKTYMALPASRCAQCRVVIFQY